MDILDIYIKVKLPASMFNEVERTCQFCGLLYMISKKSDDHIILDMPVSTYVALKNCLPSLKYTISR